MEQGSPLDSNGTANFAPAGGDTLARVRSALAQAGREAAPARYSSQIDRETVRLLRNSPQRDAVLAELELGELAVLLERITGGLDVSEGAPDPALCRLAGDALDLIRRPAVLRRIEPDARDEWAARILSVIERAHLTVGPLFRQRAEAYGSRVLFEIPAGSRGQTMTWRQAAARIDFLARGLLSLDSSDKPAPVAILSENRIEMALVDLACLTSGLVNVMVPANSTEADVGFILRHSRVGTVIVSNRRQLDKVLKNRDSLPDLQRIVSMEPQPHATEKILSLDELTSRAVHIPTSLVVARSEAVRIDDTATIMYTSGTTGTPKGIVFSHKNLVFKRFCRALALPEIGEEDTFLCFLPLCHTFGRFLELLACVFWGSKYCFLDNTSVEGMVEGMQRFRPSVFISVPKKWIQLYEAITQSADPLEASDDELAAATRRVTGDRLRFGLSAAGHLDSTIFRFFQSQGVELLSGFGMTEATGGITMTPPGAYRDDSLGTALPGIDLRLADDGELLIRGPYVMLGYLDPADGEPSFDKDGWLHSGDLMETDPHGHLRLVDRKKEIYKNVKGETIAPQRIENLFRDFESVGRAFLVGDHREYNTLLIHPNPSYQELDLSALPAEEVRDHFRSLVVSVNKFLAPYERIVDFAIIDRDLDPERQELTAKGTPRRKNVVQNFGDVVRSMYRRTSLRVGGIELTLPNWLLQAAGLTAQDIRVSGDRIVLPYSGRALTVAARGNGRTRVGSCIYRHRPRPLNLGALVTAPRLWLGNAELVDLLPLGATDRQRPGRTEKGLEWDGQEETFRSSTADRQAVEQALERRELDLLDVDRAARLLAGQNQLAALGGLRLIERVLAEEKSPVAEPARTVLRRSASSGAVELRRRIFRVLVPAEKDSRFAKTLGRFLHRSADLLDDDTQAALAELTFSPSRLEAFLRLAEKVGMGDEASCDADLARGLLRLLSRYGAAHPTSYRPLRSFLVRMSLFARDSGVRERATAAAEELQDAFRVWLGPSTSIAVDPETGEEYRWDNVIVFDEDVPAEDRARLLSAIRQTALLREAFFLFSRGSLIRLSDIPRGGVWIRLLGSRHGKSVYRITVQTRFQGAFDLAVNVNHSLSPRQVSEEIEWLILSGDPGGRSPLVEDFGGYWPAQDLWTEEFISGETLDRAMKRLSRHRDGGKRLQQVWPFLAWSTLAAYVDFWARSGKRWEIADPSMTNVVVPTQDYQTGARLVSLSARRPHAGLAAMLCSFRDEFIAPAEEKYPILRGLVGWDVPFSSLLEVLGEQEGLAQADRASRREGDAMPSDMVVALREFVARTRERGFLPKRLHFAAERYRRWEQLSEDATLEARARMLRELYETYGLHQLAPAYPEARVRFFRETVLRSGSVTLAEGLEDVIARIRSGDVLADELIDAVADLRSKVELGPEEDYFLARLSLPHLRPEDAAGFVSSHLGGRHQSEIVVRMEDDDGRTFRIRHALNPKEVERLYRLFLAARLDVRFRPEHQYLVAINDRAQIVAGIYYEIEEEDHSAHLEKIVVTESLRRRGVADGLMQEFFHRLEAGGMKTVTTGFFRPEYFYGHGFRIEKRYAGLVKTLGETPEPAD